MGYSNVKSAYEILLALERKGRVAKKRLTRSAVVFVTVE